MTTPLLQVENLRTQFFKREGVVKAVDGISFTLERGKTLAIVGESGSGKTVSMLSLIGLIPSPPGKVTDGRASLEGQDLLHLSPKSLNKIRGKDIGFIFQDPMTSLNPYLKISTQLMETIRIHHPHTSASDALAQCIAMLDSVGISDAATRIHLYPHQFSGGMRQRVMIAMALLNNPKLIIADEPTTALDVTIQAQILDLLKSLQQRFQTSMILITHDLGVVARVADDVLVMYAGKVVERGSVHDIFYRPSHPYTRALLASMPALDGNTHRLKAIAGLPPNLGRLPPGCAFAPRCDYAQDACRTTQEIPSTVISTGHESRCLRSRELSKEGF